MSLIEAQVGVELRECYEDPEMVEASAKTVPVLLPSGHKEN